MPSLGLYTCRAAGAAAVGCALFVFGVPSAPADPSTDALGFVDSTARCAAPNTAVAFGSTANSRVAICKSPAGLYGYHGVRVSDGAKLLASDTAPGTVRSSPNKDGATYRVTSGARVVSDAGGVTRREPMVSFHGPKTT